MKKKTIEDARGLAKERAGECLSKEYIGAHNNLEWQCNEGHIWIAAYTNIKSGRWCHKCGVVSSIEKLRLHDGLKVAHVIAKSKNGKCLSTEYINVETKMLWECGEGHQWEAKLSHVKNSDSWCSKCGRESVSEKQRLPGLKIAQEMSKEKGGKCLSTEYINNKTKLLWECESGHQWKASLSSVKNNNNWCQICGYLQAAKNSNNSCILYHWKTGEELVCVASYEKAVVEYLNNNKINFRWQPKTFKMPNGRTYRPDCYLSDDDKWIEIKGYFRKDALEKWNWFRTIKPNSELWGQTKLEKMGIL